MTWFRVTMACTLDADSDSVPDVLWELDSDDVQHLDFSVPQPSPVAPVDVRLTLAVRADTADLATAQTQEVLRADPAILAAGAIGSPEVTANPRRLPPAALGALDEARESIEAILDEDLAALMVRGSPTDLELVTGGYLPEGYVKHYSVELLTHWRGCIELVHRKLTSYPDTELASSGEELAAHALLDTARELLLDEPSLPGLESALAKLDEAKDLAFEDHDILMLFDPRFDGIEEGEIGDVLGVVHLHPRDWFRPFRS